MFAQAQQASPSGGSCSSIVGPEPARLNGNKLFARLNDSEQALEHLIVYTICCSSMEPVFELHWGHWEQPQLQFVHLFSCAACHKAAVQECPEAARHASFAIAECLRQKKL